eukprot:5512460-Amphidinium_carterae.2
MIGSLPSPFKVVRSPEARNWKSESFAYGLNSHAESRDPQARTTLCKCVACLALISQIGWVGWASRSQCAVAFSFLLVVCCSRVTVAQCMTKLHSARTTMLDWSKKTKVPQSKEIMEIVSLKEYAFACAIVQLRLRVRNRSCHQKWVAEMEKSVGWQMDKAPSVFQRAAFVTLIHFCKLDEA